MKKKSSKQTCYLVCSAHLDPVWLWNWEEGRAEALSTFRTACDFCEEYPDFVFQHNEALLYEYVEKTDPELFERIRKHVRAGRWRICGGSWLQPDMVSPSGEAIVRQYLFGLRYFMEKFGVRPLTAYNFDSFGHPRGMVRILSGAGFRYYVFCRPERNALALPVGTFRWTVPGGESVFVRRSDEHYLTQGRLQEKMASGKWPDYYASEGDFSFLWGLGNHGGGASREEYAQMDGLRNDHPSVRFMESGFDEFFEASRRKRDFSALPAVSCDMQPSMTGCYTSMTRVKQAYFQTENLACTTERWASFAAMNGLEYPAADFRTAWKDLLFCAFHDILPGSGIPSVERDSLQCLARAREIFRRIRAASLFHLLRNEKRAGEGITPFFVFNPHPYEVSSLVEFEYGNARQWGANGVIRRLRDEKGRVIEAQFERPEMNLDSPTWGEWRAKAVFMLTVPPFSRRRIEAEYDTIPMDKIKPAQLPPMPDPAAVVVDGTDFRFSVSRRTGLLSVWSRGRAVLKNSFRPEIFNDKPDSWSAPSELKIADHGFRLMTRDEATQYISSEAVNPGYRVKCRSVLLVEDGPLRSVVEAHFISGRNTLTLRYFLEKKRARATVEQEWLCPERDKLYKLHLVPAGTVSGLETEKCYGIDREEFPPKGEKMYQGFIRCLEDDGSAWGVIGYGTHGFHWDGGLHLSAIRTPAYSVMTVQPDNIVYRMRQLPHQDTGERTTKFTLVFGADAEGAGLFHAQMECIQPLEGFAFYPGKTKQTPAPAAPFTWTSAGAALTVFKRAEDGRGWILRFRETAGAHSSGVLKFRGKAFRIHFHEGELKTFRLTSDGCVKETDLIEGEFSSGKQKPSVK